MDSATSSAKKNTGVRNKIKKMAVSDKTSPVKIGICKTKNIAKKTTLAKAKIVG